MDLIFGSDSDSSSSDDELDLAITVGDKVLNLLEDHTRSSSSRIPRPNYIIRDFIEGHSKLMRHYFVEVPKYPAKIFRRIFHMQRDLFIRIKEAVEAHDSFFVQKINSAGRLGLSALQKVTAAMRMLAYGVTCDLFDEYIQISESTTTESMKRFVKDIIVIFGNQYLRRPNGQDIDRLLAEGERRGTPGMLGSIDCMHWEWKNCPTQWSGIYSGRHRKPTIVLEAIASFDTWIWHAFFGLPGSHIDINVLQRSSLVNELVEGHAAPVNFVINGRDYDMGYYLADGIYPTWDTFVKTIPAPVGVKRQHFSKVHEALRKDVERAFGILQSRFAIIRGPARYYNEHVLKEIMMACIIMHNMIVENERGSYLNASDFVYDQDPKGPSEPEILTKTNDVRDFIQRNREVRDAHTHTQLQENLVEHLWEIYSNS